MHSFFMNFQRKFLHNNHKEHGQISNRCLLPLKSSRLLIFYKIGVPENFAKVTEKSCARATF